MLDPSIEEVREYVNNYRVNNNKPERDPNNEKTQSFSDNELIKLLESDISLNIDEQHNTVSNLTEKTVENDAENRNSSNVMKVAVNDIEGLTLEIRESFYLKLNSALSRNYKTTFKKQDKIILTEKNICDIAKKMEYGILSTAKDLNSYKLAGAEAVVNIEKKTNYQNLYESLFNEIELLRLCNKMQTVASEIVQQPVSVLSIETESSLCQETKIQDAQFSTELLAAGAVQNDSAKVLDSQSTTVSESEYFSCSSVDRRVIETQQNTETPTISGNAQDPDINLPREKLLETVQTPTARKLSILTEERISLCNNKINVEKISTESNNVLDEVHNNNVSVANDVHTINIASAETNEISQKKKRKRNVEWNLQPSTNGLSSWQNKSDVTNDNKRQKLMKIEVASETSAIDISVNNNYKENSNSQLKDCSRVTLDTHAKIKDETFANESLLLQRIKLEPEYITTEPISPSPSDVSCSNDDKELISLENSSNKKTIHKKCAEFTNKNKIHCSDGQNSAQDKSNKFEIFSQNVTCKIKNELDISQYSMRIGSKDGIDENFFNSITVKKENSSSVHEVSSNKIEGKIVVQNSEHNEKNETALSLSFSTHIVANVEVTAAKKNGISNVDVSTDPHETNTVNENNCLINEEAFELERARLDRLCVEMKKKCTEESDIDVIHNDYKEIFKIILPIIRKYYPSEFIPDEGCYGHILQRLQIDLTHADICDDDKVVYIEDSIKTRRYLCDHCIVQ